MQSFSSRLSPPSPPHRCLRISQLALHLISYPASWHSLSFRYLRGRSPSTLPTRWLLFVRGLWPVASILLTPRFLNGLTGSPMVVARGLSFSHVLRSPPAPTSLLHSLTVLMLSLPVSPTTLLPSPTAPPCSSSSPLLLTLPLPQSSLSSPSSFRGSPGSIRTVVGLALLVFSGISLISSYSAPGGRHRTPVLQMTILPQSET